jgi:uncharacterized damage-inducible protein DinB
MKRILATLIACAVPALCADAGMVPMLVKHLKVSKAYTVQVAEKMPEDGYASKPNPAQMTFAEQIAHIAGANAFFISKVSGTKSPVGKPDKMDKTTVVKMLNDSFDWVIASVEKLTPEQLHAELDTPDGRMTGLEAVLFALDHTTHHRGQCIVYLRVKNIAPPEYQF